MLADDIARHPYNKADIRQFSGTDRPHTHVDRVQAPEHQRGAEGARRGLDPGYKPAFNFQITLVDAVARWLALHPHWLDRIRHVSDQRPAGGCATVDRPTPTPSNQPPPQELEQMLHTPANSMSRAGRAKPRLGRAGENVLAHERASLHALGREDLARKVRWVSEEDGDGAGYDIESFAPTAVPPDRGETTNGWERTLFLIPATNWPWPRNAGDAPVPLWNFSREPKAF